MLRCQFNQHTEVSMPEAHEQRVDGHKGVVYPEVIPPGKLDATPIAFEVSLTVRQAAAEAARELEVRAKDPGFQNADKEELNPDETLAEAGVNDGYVLYLIDTAGGQ
jgi:hypothetical protein